MSYRDFLGFSMRFLPTSLIGTIPSYVSAKSLLTLLSDQEEIFELTYDKTLTRDWVMENNQIPIDLRYLFQGKRIVRGSLSDNEIENGLEKNALVKFKEFLCICEPTFTDVDVEHFLRPVVTKLIFNPKKIEENEDEVNDNRVLYSAIIRRKLEYKQPLSNDLKQKIKNDEELFKTLNISPNDDRIK